MRKTNPARLKLHARLTLRYSLALGSVAVLILASFGLMENALRTQVLGAKLLNVAGRQRMLCQRVDILVRRAQDETGPQRQEGVDALGATLRELLQGHDLLMHGPPRDLDMTASSPGLQQLRTEGDGIEGLFHGFVGQAQTLHRALENGADLDAVEMRKLSQAGDELLLRLDGRMSGLQSLGETAMTRLSGLVLLLLAAALAGLAMTGLLLFRPMVAEVVRDREHLENLNRSLESQAGTDKLTGAFNRRAWDAEIAREFAKARRQGQRLCLVMADLDYFKRVNDAHGHLRGDQVLQEFTDRLRQAVRASDTVYRLGGEEFAVLLPGTDIEDGRVTAEKLRQKVAGKPLAGLPTTASFGVAATDGMESPDELYRRADQALYLAKRAGRNRVESVSARNV